MNQCSQISLKYIFLILFYSKLIISLLSQATPYRQTTGNSPKFISSSINHHRNCLFPKGFFEFERSFGLIKFVLQTWFISELQSRLCRFIKIKLILVRSSFSKFIFIIITKIFESTRKNTYTNYCLDNLKKKKHFGMGRVP